MVELQSLDREIKFLSDILTKLNECNSCEAVTNNISERISILKSQEATVRTASLVGNTHARFIVNGRLQEYERMLSQIEFLMGLYHQVGGCGQCDQMTEYLSEKTVSLRMLLASVLAVGPNDHVSRAVANLPDHVFLPNEARETLVVKWISGGGAVIYDMNIQPPAQDLLNTLSSHYTKLEWHALGYDLYDPLEVGGLRGQWRNGFSTAQFWTQSWVNQSSEVVNVSLYSYDQTKIYVVITYSYSYDSQKALDYYYKIHGSSDTDPNRDIIDRILKDGYRLIPLRKEY
jgi:hypothetical protein